MPEVAASTVEAARALDVPRAAGVVLLAKNEAATGAPRARTRCSPRSTRSVVADQLAAQPACPRQRQSAKGTPRMIQAVKDLFFAVATTTHTAASAKTDLPMRAGGTTCGCQSANRDRVPAGLAVFGEGGGAFAALLAAREEQSVEAGVYGLTGGYDGDRAVRPRLEAPEGLRALRVTDPR
jgi:hypothetical protein